MKKINIHDEDIEWAFFTSVSKLDNTFDSWKKRSDNQRFLDIFIGDLAKNIVKRNLIELYPNIENCIKEYDKIRDDKFKGSDEYDLLIQEKYTVEVKSSIEKYSNNIDLIKKNRNIIVNINNVHESKSDFIFQIMYIPNNRDFFTNISNGSFDNDKIEILFDKIKKELLNNTVSYIAGFITDLDVQQKNETYSVESKSKNDVKREYLKLPLNSAHKIEIFRDKYKEYKLKNKY